MDAAQSLPRVAHQWALPTAFVLAAILVFPLDVSIATAFTGDRSRSMSEFLEVCEVFGHGFGATLILIAVIVLTPSQWRGLPWLIIGSLGAGMAANLVKLCIPRTRPRDFDLISGSVWDTFIRTQGDSHPMQSMPSSHTATAVGLAIVLATLYPRGRYYFSILALLVGIQRIATQAHFPSDVCVGAVVGCVVGICSASLLRPDPVTLPVSAN